MSDDCRAKDPTPVLRTRPATMLTAIGLCVFIMVMQLLPQFSEGGLNRVTTTAPTTTAVVAR
jgi:type II secretory pathway component PulF